MRYTKKDLRELFNRSVLVRDAYKCRICGSKESLVVHHITDRHEMPYGGYASENGIAVCPSCHIKCEKYHITDGKEWEEGLHPFDLYVMIGSSYDEAFEKSIKLGEAE